MEKIDDINKWLYESNKESFADLNEIHALVYRYTLVQAKAIDIILKELNIRYGNYNIIEPNYIRDKLKKDLSGFTLNQFSLYDYNYITEKLIEDGYVKNNDNTKHEFKITTKGKELIIPYENFEEYLKSKFELNRQVEIEQNLEKKKKEALDKLQIESLERGISKMKYWWLFILLNIVITISVSIGIEYIKQNSSLNSTNPYPHNNTD